MELRILGRLTTSMNPFNGRLRRRNTTRRTTAMTRLKHSVLTPTRMTALRWLFPSDLPSTVCSEKLSSSMALVFFLCGISVAAKSNPRDMLKIFYADIDYDFVKEKRHLMWLIYEFHSTWYIIWHDISKWYKNIKTKAKKILLYHILRAVFEFIQIIC